MRISIVSPHRDDACFSMGLSLLRWAHAGHRIRIVNCFTRSNYAPFSDADTMHPNDLLSYVSAMREREDEAFVRRLPGSEKVDLRMKDAPIRLRCAVDAVCDRPVDNADPAIAKILAALQKRVHPAEADLLLLPFGVGHHVDHSTVREAALPLAQHQACGFYEDLPYGLRPGAPEEIEDLVEEMRVRCGMKLTPMTCRGYGEGRASKRKLVGLYSSQIDDAAADDLARSVERFSGERVWANDQLSALVNAGIKDWSAAEVRE